MMKKRMLYYLNFTEGQYFIVTIDDKITEAPKKLRFLLGETADYAKKWTIANKGEFVPSKINYGFNENTYW